MQVRCIAEKTKDERKRNPPPIYSTKDKITVYLLQSIIMVIPKYFNMLNQNGMN
jgi:hypothetical protein